MSQQPDKGTSDKWLRNTPLVSIPKEPANPNELRQKILNIQRQHFLRTANKFDDKVVNDLEALIDQERREAFDAGWQARVVGVDVTSLAKSKENYLAQLKGDE